MIDINILHDIDEYYNDKDELINTLVKLAKFRTFVFRGYNKQDQLLPNIIREKDYSQLEEKLLNEFEKYGSHYFMANTTIDFLSYAQHYGLPTRLIDFTYNPFIALSFALFTPKSNANYKEHEDKEYYYIRFCNLYDNVHLKSLPKHTYFTFGTFELDSISKKSINEIKMFSNCLNDSTYNFYNDYTVGLFECDINPDKEFNIYKEKVSRKIQDKKLCFIDPNQSNQRIIMQQGLFMLPYTLSKEEHLKLIYKNTKVLKIHKSLRDDLLLYLNTLGFNTFRLMPDLSSICNAITQKIKEGNS